jgi:hypothetical protein
MIRRKRKPASPAWRIRTQRRLILALQTELEEVKSGYWQLDRNWKLMHETAMKMFRDELESPDATVPEMIAQIRAYKEKARRCGPSSS